MNSKIFCDWGEGFCTWVIKSRRRFAKSRASALVHEDFYHSILVFNLIDKSNVALAHPIAAELRGITIEIKGTEQAKSRKFSASFGGNTFTFL